MEYHVEYSPVNSKQDFVRRYAKGEFGNRSPTWLTLGEFLADEGKNQKGLYHIRNRIPGGETYYDLELRQVAEYWDFIVRGGHASSDLYISEMCPTERTIGQGEVQVSGKGYDLRATTIAKPMRDALAEEEFYRDGVLAKVMLETWMNTPSYEWLQTLFERYPGHVVEFTCFDVCWGTVPNMNTVFWEVRNY